MALFLIIAPNALVSIESPTKSPEPTSSFLLGSGLLGLGLLRKRKQS